MEVGLYIHIPFCRKRCNYCDFYTFGGAEGVSDDYIKAVKREIAKHKGLICRTVYFGGGTPSLMTANQVKDILSILNIKEGAEITLEANPDTLTPTKLKEFRKVGINRLSIGVQTVFDKSLKDLGRIHDSRKAALAFKWAREAGFENISGDLMLGLDNYSLEEMNATIDFFKAAGATHVSAYMLKIEEGTPFWYNRPKNMADDTHMADFYLAACEKLAKEGYAQYEISNFCKPGYHSRHNTIYWKLEDYLGIGPSAHSCMGGQRFYYPRDLDLFMEKGETVMDGTADADDYIMLSLRLAQGLDINYLREHYHLEIDNHIKRKLKIYEKQGFIRVINNCISLTPKGFLVENVVASDIMSGVNEI